MANDDEFDTETRRGLRILADSTKAKGSDGAARRLYNAADTGSAAVYQQAKALFDALPPEKRSSIQSTAETKAGTLREAEIRRKSDLPTQLKPGPVEFAPWKLAESDSTVGVFQSQEPERKRRPAAAPLRPENTGKARTPKDKLDALREEMLRTLKN